MFPEVCEDLVSWVGGKQRLSEEIAERFSGCDVVFLSVNFAHEVQKAGEHVVLQPGFQRMECIRIRKEEPRGSVLSKKKLSRFRAPPVEWQT